MTYTLSYVNMPTYHDNLDRKFETMENLKDFILDSYGLSWTSYQVIVVQSIPHHNITRS